jgi:hypothetical protein
MGPPQLDSCGSRKSHDTLGEIFERESSFFDAAKVRDVGPMV